MSINIIETEYIEVEYIYCDLCRGGNLSYKCANFKQYPGWYCRNCYELIDEDADEYNDDNYIITLHQLKCYIEVSNNIFCKDYYNKKTVLKQLIGCRRDTLTKH